MTLDDANDKIKHLNLKIISNYTNFYSKCIVECEFGHSYEIVPSAQLHRNRFCKFCNGDTLNTDIVNSKLFSKNLKLIGEYIPSSRKHSLLCLGCGDIKQKNVRDTLYIKSNIGCDECRKKSTTIKQIPKYDDEKFLLSGFKNLKYENGDIHCECINNHNNKFKPFSKKIICVDCISEHNNIKINKFATNTYQVSCNVCNHEWKSTLNYLMKNPSCIRCNYSNNINHRWMPTDDDYRFFLNKRGFDIIDKNPILKCDENINMICPNGHHINVPPIRILRNKDYKCAKCVGRAKLSFDDISNRLIGRKIILLDKNPPNLHKKALFKCGVCDFEWTTKIDSVLNSNKSGCPSCCKRGYDINKEGVFYIHEITSSTGKKGIKYGISNNLKNRKLMQLRASNIEMNTLFTKHGDGLLISNIEKFIKQKYKQHSNYFLKHEMADGYTETLSLQHYKSIVEDVNAYH